MLRHPLCATDIAMFTILVCQTSLTIGTLSRHLRKRPDLKPLVNRLMRFETVGIYLLTERGHGLDAFNIETTATKTPDGFILNTPREEAAKFVHCCSYRRVTHPSVDSCQDPRPASVFRRLLLLWRG
jgi:hypothetical protein